MKKEPIAIVGMSCRIPGGANNPDEFWNVLNSNSNVIEEIGNNRWNTDYYFHPDRRIHGKSYTKSAGLIDNVYAFDADFFGITPREAAQMDPQQRHLLELVWEALEDGHQVPEQLAGTDCAVYVGISSTDYASSRYDDPCSADVHFMTGNTLSIAANRISYFYDLHGPSMAIDTACSSSLVAAHQACQAIWNKESKTAIVGSMHLLLSPYPFVGFSKASMLSPDGMCRVFDANANGYVRSEGGAVLYLKSLADAEENGDPIHAVIIGSGVNTDGRKNTLTIPDREAQNQLIGSVYREAEVTCDQICYIEAHGTGTPIGDPIESESIGWAIGKKRNRSDPILIGSVKSNLGHLEPASGMAGLLKVIMSLKHREIPATIGINEENPQIDFKNLNIKLAKENISLQGHNSPLIMGVNSFGFGGSNAHLLLREYKHLEIENVQPPEECPPLIIHANDHDSLKRRAQQIRFLLESKKDKKEIYDILGTVAKKRQRLKLGLATVSSDYDSLKEHLDTFIDKGDDRHVVIEEKLATNNTRVAFVFSGNGSQWQGMGRGLLKEPIFIEVINNIDALFKLKNDWSILDELQCDETQSNLDKTEYAQPLLFAIQVGIFHLLQHYGLKPDALVGHSVGEVAAAYASGALSLEEAVKVISARSHTQGTTRGCGRMLAARISENTAIHLLEKYGNGVELAAVNSPCSVTLTGEEKLLTEISEQLIQDKIFCRMLDVDYAFHSHKMEIINSDLSERLSDLESTTCHHDLFSTVTGNKIKGQEITAEYWWQNVRQRVLFSEAITNMINEDCGIFIEIGPHPVLLSYIYECVINDTKSIKTIATLKRNNHDNATVIKRAVLRSYLSGSKLDFGTCFSTDISYVPLPAYPWSRQEYLLERSCEADTFSAEQKLLGWKIKHVDGIWENQIDTQLYDFLSDHIIDDTPIFPATGYVELALEASSICFDRKQHEIEELEIRAPLILENERLKIVQFVFYKENLRFEIRSRTSLSEEQWLVHAKGKLKSTVKNINIPEFDVAQAFVTNNYCSGESLYEVAEEIGLSFGAAFRGLVRAHRDKDHIYSELAIPEKINRDLSAYKLHPAILDSCFHSLLAVFPDINTDRYSPFVPVRLGNIILRGDQSDIQYCLTELHDVSPRLIHASFTLFDGRGKVIALIKDCDFKKLTLRKKSNLQPELYQYHEIIKNIINPEKASCVPDSGHLSACVKEIFNDEKISNALTRYDEEILPLCDALASSLAAMALRRFGAHLTEFSIEEFINSANISPRYHPYIEYLLGLLQEDGKADFKNGLWKLTEYKDNNTDAIAIWRSILADYPEYYRELLYTAKLGFNLQEILSSGPEVPFNIIDKDIYSSSQIHLNEIYSKVLSEIILDIVNHWFAQQRRLRIAEISHGEETIINRLIHDLPKEYCDYTSILINSDSSYNLLQKQKTHANLQVVTFEKDNFDIENQFINGEFDILIINNYLYSTDKSYLLEKAKYLLANSGVLLIFNEMLDRLSLLNKGIDPEWFSMINSNSFFKFPETDLLSTLERSGFKDISTLTRDIEQYDHYQIISAYNSSNEKYNLEATNDYDEYCIIISDTSGDSYELGQILNKQISSNGFQSLHIGLGEHYEKRDDGSCVLDFNDSGQVNNLVSNLDLTDIKLVHYIYLVSFDLSDIEAHRSIIDEQLKNCLPVIAFANVILDKETIRKPYFWLVTSGAFNYSNNKKSVISHVNPSQGTLWGLGRTLKNEILDIVWKQLDIQDEQNYHNIATHIINELKYPDSEDEIIIRDESRFALRLQKGIENPYAHRETLDLAKDTQKGRYALQFSQTGSPEYLQWIAKDEVGIGEQEVEIKVVAAGLNFRDIMYLSGYLPDEMLSDGFAGANLGLECSGVVTRIGSQVNHLAVGDEVICFAPNSFASHVVTHHLAITHKPPEWSFEAAVTVPTAFFTAYYALEYLARIKPGEKVLIHGAAGGVGLAAIQYAKYRDAEIFATAGTDQKRQFLKLLGVDHVFDSRQLSFSDEITEITNGEGVDIIINSLAGEAVERNLTLLKPFGRFLELGKRDFYENTHIGLKPLRNNVAYFGIDADQLMAQQPELANKVFNEVMELFKAKILRPLPYTQFVSQEIKSAFRFMQQSQHIGKVIVSFHDEISNAINHSNVKEQLKLSENASYLISGGYSGLGLATAEWLAKCGAKHIYILGRRQSIPDSAQALVEKLSSQNINVYPVRCDVSDPVMLQKILKDIDIPDRPLKGIVHAAMVLEDCLVNALDKGKMENVMKPKIQGAWNLHLLTKELSLDFFIMYSSIASYIGNPGQANYVASNLYLESLSQYRQQSGLPALTVSLDAILDVGALARDEKLKDLLVNKRGITGITSEQALSLIFKNIENHTSNYLIGKPNFHLMKRSLSILNSPTYSELFIETKDESLDEEENIREIIKELSQEEAHQYIMNILINELSKIMHLDKNRIDISTSIQNFGIDSLMATELLTAIDMKFNTDISITVLADNSSIENIAKRILANIQNLEYSDTKQFSNEYEQVTAIASKHGVDVEDKELADFVDELKEQENNSAKGVVH